MQNAYIIVALFVVNISSIVVSCNHLKNEGEKLAKTHCYTSHVFPHPSLLDKNLWAERGVAADGGIVVYRCLL